MWQFRRRGEKTALLGNEDIFYLVPQLGDVAMCPTFWLSLWLVLTHAEAEAYAEEEHGVDVGHLRMFPRMDRYSGELQFDKDAEQWSTNTTFVRAWTSCGFEGKVTRHSMHASAMLRRSYEMTGRFEAGTTLTRHVVVPHLETYFKTAIDPHRLDAALEMAGLMAVFPFAGGVGYAHAPQQQATPRGGRVADALRVRPS